MPNKGVRLLYDSKQGLRILIILPSGHVYVCSIRVFYVIPFLLAMLLSYQNMWRERTGEICLP